MRRLRAPKADHASLLPFTDAIAPERRKLVGVVGVVEISGAEFDRRSSRIKIGGASPARCQMRPRLQKLSVGVYAIDDKVQDNAQAVPGRHGYDLRKRTLRIRREQRRMQVAMIRSEEHVPGAPGLEGRGEDDVIEAHFGTAPEMSRPSLKGTRE